MTQAQKVIKTRVGLLELAKQLGNVSQACQVMGYRRLATNLWSAVDSALKATRTPTLFVRRPRRRATTC